MEYIALNNDKSLALGYKFDYQVVEGDWWAIKIRIEVTWGQWSWALWCTGAVTLYINTIDFNTIEIMLSKL